MRRPADRRPQTVDPLSVAAAFVTMASVLGEGALWALAVSMAFAVLVVLAQVKGRGSAKLWGGWVSVVPILLFFIAVANLVWEATPWALGGPHPLWSSVAAAGAASIDLETQWLGLLSLIGLALAFLAGFYAGQRSRTAQSLALAISVLGSILGVLALAAQFAPLIHLQCPLLNNTGIRGALFGALLIVNLDNVFETWREKRRFPGSSGASKSVVVAVPSSLAVVIAFAALLFTSAAQAVAIATVMVLLLLAWWALVGGRGGPAPRRVLIWLAPIGGLLAAAVAILTAQHLAETASMTASRAAHWGAFWASPWSGYGLYSEPAVTGLFMTRLNAIALMENPVPPQTFLVWFEQGGILATVPLVACITWVTGFTLFAALYAGRTTGLMRMTVCISLYFGLLGLFNAGPAAAPIEMFWSLMPRLGLWALIFVALATKA